MLSEGRHAVVHYTQLCNEIYYVTANHMTFIFMKCSFRNSSENMLILCVLCVCVCGGGGGGGGGWGGDVGACVLLYLTVVVMYLELF